ncbi:putative olfactory receptor 2W6 [Pongo abelii]|uniref:putative olfactory receptor 2W6 n=1 Tax=Pongo abelii TaxID=9601 RepID=UPI0030074DF3
MTNSSVKGDFILVGFSDQPHLEKILFVAVLISYLITLVGNTLYISLALGSTECVLLAVMAFDHYAAVCKPLHYTAVMNPQLCQALAGVAWLSGVGNTLIQGTVTLWLPRCGHRLLHHFFCEAENSKIQNASSPPKDHNSSRAREQNWMENEFDKLTRVGFRRWVITNSSKLKEHILTQCKEAKNLEEKIEDFLTKLISLEKNINDLMELKNSMRTL